MYLSHFGLSEQPFARTSGTDCFYDGAGRGVTLDALIYTLTHGEGIEGIIKVTGETGSGKTMLCRLLMKRLPATIKTVYFAGPNLSQEELFHLIAKAIKFTLAESPAIAISELQAKLATYYADGKQLALLLDEAHTLPVETLEALRLLYESKSSRHGSLQIVLFGQTGLKKTLALPQARQFRNCITHHFATPPFNTGSVTDYLIFRMRAAGYWGPDIFTPEAANLIAMASGGLAQRINDLADKSLLTAFAAHTRDVEARFVEAAIRDLGIKYSPPWPKWSNLLNYRGAGASAVLAVVALSVMGWQALRSEPANVTPTAAPVPAEVIASAPAPSSVYSAVAEKAAPSAPLANSASVSGLASPVSPATKAAAPAQEKPASVTEQPGSTRLNVGGVKLAGHSLLEQRIDATKKAMATIDNNYYSIQLFKTENIQPDRMERFLARAQNLVSLSDVYVHPLNNEGQARFRITYGIYPGREQASAAMDELPQKYKTSFHLELYTLGELL